MRRKIRRSRTLSISLITVLSATLLFTGTTALCEPVTTRISVSSDEEQGTQYADSPSVSYDGRFVAFQSASSNLTPEDTNEAVDIFVRDTLLGTTTRVSVSSTGAQANGQSLYPALSADGRYVAFTSTATNLVPNDVNGFGDVFVHDRQTGTTTLVSLSTSSEQANDNSDYLDNLSISGDGRFVVFRSYANNLVSGDANGSPDIFLRDTKLGITSLISISSTGAQSDLDCWHPSVSANGRFVSFSSAGKHLAGNDNNDYLDVFRRDTQTGETVLVSVGTSGLSGTGDSIRSDISADGRYVVFESQAADILPPDENGAWDIYLRDMQAGVTQRLSVTPTGGLANDHSGGSRVSISQDGRYVAFASTATNLTALDTDGLLDVFVRDVGTGMTSLVSVSTSGEKGNLNSHQACLSGDGRYIAFSSWATNLVPDDTNDFDVFLRGPMLDAAAPLSVGDVARCLRIALGAGIPDTAEYARYNAETENPRITIADALRLARRISGADPISGTQGSGFKER